MQVAVRYWRNVGSLSLDISDNCQTTILGRHIDQNIGRVLVEISADISVNMSTNTSRLIWRLPCRPTYWSSIGRYVDRHSTNMSTDMLVDGCTKYTIQNLFGSSFTHCQATIIYKIFLAGISLMLKKMILALCFLLFYSLFGLKRLCDG